MSEYEGIDESSDPTEREYTKVPIPDEKPKPEWTVNERRAWMIKKLRKEWGVPDNIPARKISEDFDVSRRMVYKDKNIIGKWVAKHVGEEHKAEAGAVFKYARNQLLEEEEYYKASKVQEMWTDWLDKFSSRVDADPEEVAIKPAGTEDDEGFSMSFDVVSGSGKDDVMDEE